MSLANASPFAAQAVPYVAPDGCEVVIAIVKATFVRKRGGALCLADEQSPVRLADEPTFPDAQDSSVRYPSDVALDKHGTDVVIVGDAVASTPVTVMDVAARVRDVTLPLRVHGERVYYRSLGGVVIGPAALFERKAIVYEAAYGGTSEDYSVVEQRNPVGRGVAHDVAHLADRPAPTIEHPAHPITAAGEGPEPMGFGAVASHWLPRSRYAGTFDEVWRVTRMPLAPSDFDARYWNVAHPSLQFAEHLRPTDTIAILGMTPGGPFTCELPPMPVVVHGKTDDGRTLTARGWRRQRSGWPSSRLGERSGNRRASSAIVPRWCTCPVWAWCASWLRSSLPALPPRSSSFPPRPRPPPVHPSRCPSVGPLLRRPCVRRSPPRSRQARPRWQRSPHRRSAFHRSPTPWQARRHPWTRSARRPHQRPSPRAPRMHTR